MSDRLDRLPRKYAEYLSLRRKGLEDAVIAERLGIPVESLNLLSRLAERKLASLDDEPADLSSEETQAPPPEGSPEET